MTKAEFKEAVMKVLDDHDLESEVVVDLVVNDLVLSLEYDLGFEFDEDETEEAAPGLGEEE